MSTGEWGWPRKVDRVAVLKGLIDKGGKATAGWVDDDGKTALYYACQAEQPDAVIQLLGECPDEWKPVPPAGN